MIDASKWILRWADHPAALPLYCFSHAGGNAGGYMPWQSGLGGLARICAIQLPGHGARLREPLMTRFDETVDKIVEVIAREARQPFAFFGHSLGALFAFEVAHRLSRHDRGRPSHLFVSGCEAPRNRVRERGYHLLPDPALIAELKRFAGTPPRYSTIPNS